MASRSARPTGSAPSPAHAARGATERDPARSSWAGNSPHADAARQRLLDAAARCIARDGLAATGVASVAAEAGVSRPTVYRYFDDRDQLVRLALTAAADQLRATIRDRIEVLPTARDMIVEAIVVGVTEIPNDPVLRAIWSSTALDASIVTTFTESTSVAWARDCLAPAVKAAGWNRRDGEEAMEMILRFVLSLLVAPAPYRSPKELRNFLRRRLLPGLGL